MKLNRCSIVRKDIINKSFQFQTQLYLHKLQNNKSFCNFTSNLLPNSHKRILHLQNRIYNCRFNYEADQLIVTTQDNLLIYDINYSNDDLMLKKKIVPNNITWTITDSDLSANGKFLIHSTLNPQVSVFDMHALKYTNFLYFDQDEQQHQQSILQWHNNTRIYSIKFSNDSTQVIAGCGYNNLEKSACLKLFDLEKNSLHKKIHAHKNDINSICYLNRDNSSIFVSASDDGLLQMYDIRCLDLQSKPVGYFIGHFCGITYVTTKGDGKYIASNSKDQSIKLWDCRKISPTVKDKNYYTLNSFDYRNETLSIEDLKAFKQIKQSKNLFDNSLKTFRGHSIYYTLIRCHFSPPYLTDQRYIYSASASGNIYIYDTLGSEQLAAKLICKPISVIRDLAAHPFRPYILYGNLHGQINRWYYHPSAHFNDLPENCNILQSYYEKNNEDQNYVSDNNLSNNSIYNFEDEINSNNNSQNQEDSDISESQ